MRPHHALLVFLPTIAAPAAAQQPAEIIVTGHSLPQPAGAAAYGSVTVDRERLTGDASRRLEDVLRDIAGFQQFRRADSRAAHPTAQGAALRSLGGNAASRALVLLDGVPQADPFAGWVPWPALDPYRLSAVRVTRGGGAGPFGAGALAGTIELFSAGPDALPRFGARLSRGSRDALEADAGLATRSESGFATLSGRYDRGDGYVLVPKDQRGPVDVPAAYEQWSVTARSVLALSDTTELQLRGLAFDDRRRRGLDGAVSTSDGIDASVRLVGRSDWAYEALAYLQTRSFTSTFVSANAARTSANLTLDQYDVPATGLGAKFELRPPVGDAHDLQIGLDLRRNSGETRERFFFVSGSPTRLREAGGRSILAGAYVEDSWRLSDRLLLTGGLRLDRWWIADGHHEERDIATGAPTLSRAFADRSGWEPTARAGLVAALTPAVDLRAAGYLGFRLPTLNELYRPFRVGADITAANPDLDPERLRGLEAGIDFRPTTTARAGLTLFWNEVEDAISNVTLSLTDSGANRMRDNAGAIRVMGLEANAALDYGAWRLAGAYAFTDAALDGRRPAQTPRHQASVTLGWAPAGGPAASLTARYVGPQYEDDLETRRLDEAVTVDAVATVPLGQRLTLELRGENLFDALVEAGVSGTGIIDRGTPRTLWIGLRWN